VESGDNDVLDDEEGSMPISYLHKPHSQSSSSMNCGGDGGDNGEEQVSKPASFRSNAQTYSVPGATVSSKGNVTQPAPLSKNACVDGNVYSRGSNDMYQVPGHGLGPPCPPPPSGVQTSHLPASLFGNPHSQPFSQPMMVVYMGGVPYMLAPMPQTLPFSMPYMNAITNVIQQGAPLSNQLHDSVPTVPAFPALSVDRSASISGQQIQQAQQQAQQRTQQKQQAQQAQEATSSKHVYYWADKFPDRFGQRPLRYRCIPEDFEFPGYY
jgi:hypothetical protein